MPFKILDMFLRNYFIFSFFKYREAPQIVISLAYYNVCGDILQINKVKPGVGRNSCKSYCILETRLKMLCDKDTKVMNSLTSPTLKIYNQKGTFVQ